MIVFPMSRTTQGTVRSKHTWHASQFQAVGSGQCSQPANLAKAPQVRLSHQTISLHAINRSRIQKTSRIAYPPSKSIDNHREEAATFVFRHFCTTRPALLPTFSTRLFSELPIRPPRPTSSYYLRSPYYTLPPNYHTRARFLVSTARFVHRFVPIPSQPLHLFRFSRVLNCIIFPRPALPGCIRCNYALPKSTI